MFEFGLTEKQQFFLYLYQVCPNLELISEIWEHYRESDNKERRRFHVNISPYREHPCGDSSLFKRVGGFIDPDMFELYYLPRKKYLMSIKIIGKPYFLCQFTQEKTKLEESINYFEVLLNQEQIKLRPLQKTKMLEKVIDNLLETGTDIEGTIIYLYSFMLMYQAVKVLHTHPIGIDINGELCRFE